MSIDLDLNSAVYQNMIRIILSITLLTNIPAAAQWQWQNPLPHANDIHSIAARSSDKVWFGTEAGVVLHTSDGGLTWQHQQTPSFAWLRAIYFLDDQLGWAGGREEEPGILGVIARTTDGGQNWTRQQLPHRYRRADIYDIEFLNRDIGWASSGTSLMFKTIDGGNTWEALSLGSFGIYGHTYDLFVIDSLNFWVAGERVLGKTTDGGSTWQADTTLFAGDPLYTVRQIFFADTSTGWLIDDETSQLFKTTNGGQTWEFGNGNIPNTFSRIHFLSSDSGWATSTNGFFFTRDGGDHWFLVNNRFLEKFQILDANSGWGSSRSALYRLENNGRYWHPLLRRQLSGTSLDKVDFIDDQYGWITGGPQGKIAHTSDGGQSWIEQTNPSPSGLYDIFFLNRQTGWAVGWRQKVLKTTDGGANWKLLFRSSVRARHNAVYFLDDMVGWLVGGYGIDGWIWHTTDGGNTWIDQSPNPVIELNDLHFINASAGWAVGENGRVYKTIDGGLKWQRVSVPVNDDLRVITFANPDIGWILNREIGNIMRTQNGGASWEVIEVDSFFYGLNDMVFTDPGNGWISGLGGRIFHTSDGGTTWQRQASRTVHSIDGIDFVDAETGWAVGWYETILHTNSGGTVSTPPQQDRENLSRMFQLDQNFPNPFNPNTVIGYTLSADGLITLKIYDILGRRVRTLLEERQYAGRYTVSWDGHDEAGQPVGSGLYIYRLQIGSASLSRKMLLIQ